MTKTTNFEISKKLKEIGFKAEAEFFFYLDKPDYGAWHISEEGQIFANEKDDCLPSYDLETLLDVLPLKVGSYGYFLMGIRKENPLMPFAIGYNLGDDENYGMLYCDKMQDEPLADVAGRLLTILHEKNLIKF
jgi:hypothetical protein